MQNGGDFVSDVRSLAVPFSLILARIGLEKWRSQKKKNVKSQKGGCGCSQSNALPAQPPAMRGGANNSALLSSIHQSAGAIMDGVKGVNDLVGGGRQRRTRWPGAIRRR